MRVLFCGLGGIGQRHLRNLRHIVGPDRLELHAYRVLGRDDKLSENLSVENNRSVVEDYGVRVHHEIESALESKPEIVFICNPTSLHAKLALRAAQAGAHIFIEKPVSHSLMGLRELQKVIDERQLVCFVGYNFRFHPAVIRLKELLSNQFIGRLISVHFEIGEYLPNWHRYEDYRNMYAARADMGGGVILSQIHEMDLIYWLFGLPISVYTLGGKLSSLEIDVEDTASSLMNYDGVMGKVPIVLHQDYLQQPPTRRIKIIGDGGVVMIDLINNQLTVFDADGRGGESWDGTAYKRNDMFFAEMEHFLDCVSNNSQPIVTLNDGIQSLRLALAVKESLKSGDVIHLSQLIEIN
jgi:predicted dehydrogenase